MADPSCTTDLFFDNEHKQNCLLLLFRAAPNHKIVNFRLRLSRSSPTPDSDTEDPDKISIASTQHPKQSTSCFRCHPRRWRHQACCFRRVTSKAGHNSASNLKSSFTKPNRINTDTDGNEIKEKHGDAVIDFGHVH